MIDSFHFSGNSSLFQIELIGLWIQDRILLPPALSVLPSFDQNLEFVPFSFSIAT